MNAEFHLTVDIVHYDNPGLVLASGDCCVHNVTCVYCDNVFVFNVYNSVCNDSDCQVLGTLEYYYGRESATFSRPEVTIFGEHECPGGVC